MRLNLNSRIGQWYATISCNMCTLMAAAAFSWITPILDELLSSHSPVPLSNEQSSWLMSLVELGEFIGPILSAYFLNRLGRKIVILSAFPMNVGSWFILFLSRTVAALYVARIMQGLVVGIVFTAAPIYVAEIAEPKIRGLLSGIFQVMWNLGLLWTFATGPFLSYNNYIYVTSSLSVIFVASFVLLPETPHYLLMQNREEDARKSLMFFRSGNVEDELISIKNSLIEENKESSSYYDLFKAPHDRKMLMVMTSCSFVRFMSGASAIPEYLSTTISYAGRQDKKLNPVYIPIILSIINSIAAMISSFVVDHLGRRPLLFISTIGTIVINAVIGIYFFLIDKRIDGAINYSWVAYVGIGLYFILNTIGLSTLMQTLQAECFNSKNRAKAGSITVSASSIFIFITLKQYQPFIDWFGMYSNYFSFSLYSLIGSFPIFAYMKETAGKSLQEIQVENKEESAKDSSS